MTESRRDRWLSIALSVLLHGALIGLLVFGWLHIKEKAPPPTLSIDATVVNARTLKGVGFATQPSPEPKPKPAPAQPGPVPQGPPVPTPQEQTLREQAAQAEAQHQAEVQQELKKRQAAKQAEEAQQKAAARQAAQAEQKVKEAARKKARQLAQAKKRAEEKKLAEAKKQAEEKKKLAAERAAEQKAARAAALAELQHNLQQEEQSNAAAQAGLASWVGEVKGRIEDAWIKPPTAKSGLDCILDITQDPGGTVTNVSIGRCNGDGAVKESIEAAVYRASPLPPLPDPSLFQRQLIIEFKPK